ncbi:hypothetical protein P8452_51139 [Trifolium repens]|nr:hypothetical protein P8452_51139 [Trifolium repens]
MSYRRREMAENNEFFSTPFIFSLLSHLTSFSFFTTHGFIFTTSHHHRRSLPPLLSLPPSPLSTTGIQSPSHTTNPLHYRQQAFSPSRSSSPSYVLQQTSNLEKIDGFVKQGGWNEFYIARGRTCSETVSKQGEANDGNCNNGYCSGCSSSIVRHASELNAGFGKHEIIALQVVISHLFFTTVRMRLLKMQNQKLKL